MLPRSGFGACVALLIMSFALLGAGCASLSPDVGAQMIDIRIGESRALQTTGTVVLRLTNRGTRDISLKGASMSVSINGELVGEGVADAPIELAALSSVEVPLEVSLSNLSLAMRIGPALQTGVFLYRVDGKLFPKGWLPPIEVSNTGQIDLRQFQRSP